MAGSCRGIVDNDPSQGYGASFFRLKAFFAPLPMNMDRNTNSVDEAARLLRAGGLVAFPTETVYGLGASLFHLPALARVFEAKRRPRFDPLIVHIGSREQLAQIAQPLPAPACLLADRFWPGPLTLVLPKKPAAPDLATAGLPTVAVRMPAHAVALNLIQKAGVPVAAPSANVFGSISPTTAQHVHDGLGDKVDFVLDGGPCTIGFESTIVSFAAEPPILLRPGGLPMEDIETLIGPLATPGTTQAPGQALPAPGMLPRHYAPRTPLQLLRPGTVPKPDPDRRIGVLAMRPPVRAQEFAAVAALAPSGEVREAAAALFGAMRHLDQQGLDIILAEPVPDQGLGRAINDRLRRAACRLGDESYPALSDPMGSFANGCKPRFT